MDIIIAGGGIGGLTAAIALARAGHAVQVFEQSDLQEPTGMGVGLQPFTIGALHSIGLRDITDHGIEIESTNFYTHDGRLLYTGGARPSNAPPKLGIKRSALHEQLIHHAKRHVQLRSQTKLVDISKSENHVTVTFEDRKNGAVIRETCDLLIGADGLHSQVRRTLFPEHNEFNYSGITTWRGVSVFDDFLNNKMLLMGGKQAKTVIYPIENLPNGQVAIYWAAEVFLPEANDGDVTQLRNTKADFNDFASYFKNFSFKNITITDLYRQADNILRFPIVDKAPLKSWVQNCVVLLGDAAHPMFPMGGNGASQAIIDAVTLGNALTNCNKSNMQQGLKRYEELRLEKVNGVVLANRKLGPDCVLTDYEHKSKTHCIEELQPHFSHIVEAYKQITAPLNQAI